VTFEEDLKLLRINTEIQNNNISEELNNQYYIDSDFLYELGIRPFSTLYMIEDNIEYSISYNIISSYHINNVVIELDEYLMNNNLSLSETLTMRGVDLSKITYFPIRYDYQNQSLEVIEDIEIVIIENGSASNNAPERIIPISKEFEILLESMVINLDIESRTTDDFGSILYICGGSSASNSYLEDLIQWRKEQGYKVYSVNTSITGASQSSIKSYIEDAYYTWEYPPEHIVLVGDTGGSYQIGYSNASGGESDYPYTLIEGNDLLPEMFIGRISASSSSDLSNIINKTLAYEKATFLEYTGTNWYESSALVGDPSATGNSAIITNEYIENILNAFDFDNIETCYGCGYSSWMQNRLEEGILYFNYRGYIGTSGFSSSHINNANNGYMTPFVTFITCSTGGFSGTSITESFIRAGSVSNPKGAVAAIGTATSSTHTVPNNILDMGIYDGIFSKGLETAGAALVNGKLTLYNTYSEDPSQMVYKFTHWNNLMGDPVLHLWKDTPQIMTVEYPEIINLGTDLISVNVLDEDGYPVSGARVVIYESDDEVYYSYTNEDGDASVNCEDNIDLSAKVTVLKDNYIPFNESISIGNQDMHIQINNEFMFYVDDDHPENPTLSNGLPNPGEIIDIYFYLDNLSNNSIESLDGYISSGSEKLDIIDGDFQIDYLSPSIEGPNLVGPVQLYIHEDLIATDFTDLSLAIINESDGLSNWNLNIPFEIMSPNITIESIEYSSPNPGDIIELDLTLKNIGGEVLEDCYISVDIINSLIDFTQHESFIGDIFPGQVGVNLEPLIVEFSEDIIDGSVFNFNLNIYNDNGFNQNINLNITVGAADEHDPTGPDAYGYYIYDWTDVGYSLTPFYNWIEIDPSEGGGGTDLGISDSGNGNNITNSTKYVDLPFLFTFYGEEYNEISVNANGWIAFGHSNMESFRNYQLPGAGGPSPMIAAFWDDLKTSSNSKVFKYIGDDHVIIEWMDMKTYQHNDNQTFQVILYNSATPTGDGEIKIQYKEFNNTTNGDYTQYTPYHGCYSTVGIENHQATVGLEYTFDNKYPDASAHLQDQSALFITTRNTTVLTSGDVNQDDEINILDIVMVINHILVIEELDSIGEFVADMDGNGSINILDVILVINIILDY
jgi:hypothetical protein